MKRRTIPTDSVEHQHYLAFDHALELLKNSIVRYHNRQKTHNRRGIRVRFTADLQREDGSVVEIIFSRTQGFRLEIPGDLWHTIVTNRNNKATVPRRLAPRLAAYRDALVLWQQRSRNPLTFRAFNLILAAISYDQIPSPPCPQT